MKEGFVQVSNSPSLGAAYSTYKATGKVADFKRCIEILLVVNIISVDFGAAMDRYCIKVGTMTKIMKMEHCSSARDMVCTILTSSSKQTTKRLQLDLVSHAEEFATIRFAAGEKPFLNSLQKNPNIRFPLTERVTCIADKVFLVLQVRTFSASQGAGPLPNC